MSAGDFQYENYQLSSDNGSYIGRIRIQPETLEASFNATANAAPAGTRNMPGSVKVSGGNREIGVSARTVTIKWSGTPPAGYSGDNVTIPVLDPAVYAAWTLDSTGTYLGTAATIVGRATETVR